MQSFCKRILLQGWQMKVIDIDKCAHMTSSHLECKNCLAFKTKRKPSLITNGENTMHQLGWKFGMYLSLQYQKQGYTFRKNVENLVNCGDGAHKDAFIFLNTFFRDCLNLYHCLLLGVGCKCDVIKREQRDISRTTRVQKH